MKTSLKLPNIKTELLSLAYQLSLVKVGVKAVIDNPKTSETTRKQLIEILK